MRNLHEYKIGITWKGSIDVSKNYRYDKTYELEFENKPNIVGSADATFHGDKDLYNPEEMLLSALASCYMMSFFYLCSKQKIKIDSYYDSPVGFLKVNPNGSGQFEKVMLQPVIKTSCKDTVLLYELFSKAEDYCFIARSCNFIIKHNPIIN
ncbi:organic hydroperoxide reductase OsmC/OhrA [Wenyingzhuangia heitensis]|uniref:Organic hydroperoxide reductase OsmC/OhrA n=1 Tax=Wenyingzhuangia heitensis TaxID=1487859 RepID=A0ABX0UCK9_9FLAO|nr:OsmC family protein [Wenyingzhuangia heitensis]NIJ46574.1 organic hydroperoxide reductase OsmC/OhrA [Wenyingzhuangia heitensis]